MEQSARRIEEEATFQGAGGLAIAYRSWRGAGPPRGVVVIVPGFNSYSGYYGWVAEQLITLGLSVYAVDLRGRGKSDGERFYVSQFADYLADVAGIVDLATSREPGLPLFMLGHSAGGVLACLYAVEHQATLAGLVCESFAFQTPAPEFALAVLKGLGHVFPHAHVLRLKNEDFSRDPAVVAAMNADPLIADETQPTQTVAELVRADERLKKDFPRMTLPVLILHGTADKAARASGSQAFFDAAGSSDKTLRLYDGHVHDLLNDVGKEIVMADIKNWISARLSKPIKEAVR
jgi:acylglycerol lipase